VRPSTGLLSLLLLALGCALLPQAQRAEPGIIVVRNKSGRDVLEVRLANASATPDPAVRHGSLSPVPQGVSQVVVRPTDAPPLAHAVDVSWTDSSGETWSVRVDLDEALGGATGGPDLALVFELRPVGELQAHAEDRSVGGR
jgi:hypothetical protein